MDRDWIRGVWAESEGCSRDARWSRIAVRGYGILALWPDTYLHSFLQKQV